jgi:ribonucleoside-diphosphate reductase alpha chain
VAAIGCAIQQIIARRESELARTAAAQAEPATQAAEPAPAKADEPALPAGYALPPMVGKKCPECGAHAMIRKDGCDACTQCGHLGACG